MLGSLPIVYTFYFFTLYFFIIYYLLLFYYFTWNAKRLSRRAGLSAIAEFLVFLTADYKRLLQCGDCCRFRKTGSIDPGHIGGSKPKVTTSDVVRRVRRCKTDNPQMFAWEIRQRFVKCLTSLSTCRSVDCNGSRVGFPPPSL